MNKKVFVPTSSHHAFARRPQNRSGIRSTLTRSDLVLGRLLVEPFKHHDFI